MAGIVAALAKTFPLGLPTSTPAIALRMATGARGAGAAALVVWSHVITSSLAVHSSLHSSTQRLSAISSINDRIVILANHSAGMSVTP